MKEYLFRGKRIDNGEWVYGDLLTKGIDFDYAIRVRGANELGSSDIAVIDPATVGQYTGLTDKNGKKIFEGDIVRYRPEDWCEPIQSVVEYCADKWNYPAFDLKDHDYEANGLQCAHEEGIGLEVIGNIHDNPELLEVEQ